MHATSGGHGPPYFLVPEFLLGNLLNAKLCCAKADNPSGYFEVARQSLACKCVPKQELGDERMMSILLN